MKQEKKTSEQTYQKLCTSEEPIQEKGHNLLNVTHNSNMDFHVLSITIFLFS